MWAVLGNTGAVAVGERGDGQRGGEAERKQSRAERKESCQHSDWVGYRQAGLTCGRGLVLLSLARLRKQAGHARLGCEICLSQSARAWCQQGPKAKGQPEPTTNSRTQTRPPPNRHSRMPCEATNAFAPILREARRGQVGSLAARRNACRAFVPWAISRLPCRSKRCPARQSNCSTAWRALLSLAGPGIRASCLLQPAILTPYSTGDSCMQPFGEMPASLPVCLLACIHPGILCVGPFATCLNRAHHLQSPEPNFETQVRQLGSRSGPRSAHSGRRQAAWHAFNNQRHL